MNNEKTGKRAGSIAGSILSNLRDVPATFDVVAMDPSIRVGLMEFLANIGKGKGQVLYLGKMNDERILAASALTQRPDRKKKR